MGLVIVPSAIYVFWFYIHFAILNQSGPGDLFMSPQFQATLENSPVSLLTIGMYILCFHVTYKIDYCYLSPRSCLINV